MYDCKDEFLGIANRLFELTQKIELGDQTTERVTSFCLHARIVDLASSVAALFKSHDVAGIPHLVRGQLEAFADLRNLQTDPKYVGRMEIAYFKEVKRVLSAVEREGIDQKGIPGVSASLKAAQQHIDEQMYVGKIFRTRESFR